jgi:hypothetical protein
MNQDEWDTLQEKISVIVNRAVLVDDFGCSIPADGAPEIVVEPIMEIIKERDAAIRQEALEEVEKVAEGMKIGELKPHEVEERTWVMCNTQVPDAYDLALTDLTNAITKLKGEV